MSLSPPAEIVDLSAFPSASADVRSRFDALAPGTTLILRSAARPVSALETLRAERPGAYEWTPLVEGPEHWEVEVFKRSAPSPLRGVTEALGWDHDRLDGLDQAAAEAWEDGDPRLGPRLLLRFAFGLRRHIRFEESALFPEFERITGMAPDRGPTSVMRLEHRAIEPLLQEMENAAARGERPAGATRAEMRALLHEHNVKEEKVLYPMLDRGLAAREADGLVFRFQAMDPAR